MSGYLEPLPELFDKSRNVEYAKSMSAYFRNQFSFFGIKSSELKEIFKNYVEQYGLPSDSELNSVLKKLWSMDEREYHHFGVLLLQKLTKKFIKDQIILFEYLIVNKSWWDTVDGLSSWIIGEYFKLYPEQIKPVTGRWINSNNFWLQRVALLFQLKYKEKTNESLLYSYILIVSDSKEFFIQKAIGWILREYSKTNPASVKNFITNNKLAALSVREGSKYI